jgi:hypothetical protein
MNPRQKIVSSGKKSFRVAYYISSHGFGHASRAAQVIAALPRESRVYVKTLADPTFLQREAKRPIELTRLAYDFGAWQASNLAIDWDKTFSSAMAIHSEGLARLPEEEQFLKAEGIDVVVCDIPPLPLVAASHVGIPAICVANFTWVEVFRRAARGIAERESFLRELERLYAKASLLLKPGFSVTMRAFKTHTETQLIARRGRNIRKQLCHALGLRPRTRLVLTYFGKWSMGDLNLKRASEIKDIAFLSFDSSDKPLIKLDPSAWQFEDVIASVDAVLAKPGYGTLAECMANGVPVVYYPRCEFSEYYALRRELDRWGGAIRISTRDFVTCRWKDALERAFTLHPRRVPCNGASQIAEYICKFARKEINPDTQR